MPNSAKHEIFQKYLFGCGHEKIKNSEKMLKNTENSGDSGHTRTTVPNSAKHEIFQKYLFGCSCEKIKNSEKMLKKYRKFR